MKILTSKKDFEKTTQQNPRHQRIAASSRKEKFTLVQLAFTIEVSVPFVNFLTLVQSEGPLVHIIYKALEDLLKKVMKRFFEGQSYLWFEWERAAKV